ncbi:hypothetical protein DRP07_04210 [Archaeoglobales archaeon]|nr:MAG: hypothetical protein DRP07_04210 [Archaeoglobales archaeon]
MTGNGEILGSSIRIKIDEVEIEVKGSEKFVKENFEKLFYRLVNEEKISYTKKSTLTPKKDIEKLLGFSLEDLKNIYDFGNDDIDINYLELKGRGKQLKASLILLLPLKVVYRKTPIKLTELSKKIENWVDVSHLRRDLSNPKYRKYIKIQKKGRYLFVDILPPGIDKAKELLKEQIRKVKSK